MDLPTIDTQAVLAFPPRAGFLERFQREYKTPLNVTLALFNELKKFLLLVAHLQRETPDRRFSPPRSIDAMWHHFLVDDTELYGRFCRDHFGTFIHHRSGEVISWRPLADRAAVLGIQLDGSLWYADEGDADCV